MAACVPYYLEKILFMVTQVFSVIARPKTMNSEFGWRWYNIVEFYMWLVAIVEPVLKFSIYMQERARREHLHARESTKR